MLATNGLILTLLVVYGVIVAVLVWLIKKLGSGTGQAIVAGCVTFGVTTGILAATLWPYDSCVLANLFGVWLGDWIYRQAVEWLGDPHSTQAHETVPWLCRIPQSYAFASAGMGLLAGLVLQWLHSQAQPVA